MLRQSVARAVVAVLMAAPVRAQTACDVPTPIIVGSEWDRYVRVVQQVGGVPLEPWSLRAFSPQQDARLTPPDSFPWTRDRSYGGRWCRGRLTAYTIAPRSRLVHNSGFPLGWNDAAVWQGRGLTASIEGGFGGRYGPLSVRIAPLLFVAQNGTFALRPTGLSGAGVFADWRNGASIDLPQRFGDAPYARVDPGESEIRLDVAGIALGVSTRSEHWGGAAEHPVVLGNNAPGIPRLFFGTAAPLRIPKVGRVHGRVFYGVLGESAYSPLHGSGFTRLASAVAGVFQPDLFPGLELGAGRFFHVLQSEWALPLRELARPFGTLFKIDRSLVEEPENQIASVFARLVFPRDGVELYGEFGREDHNWDLKEFWQFLDHDSAYLLGGAKSWRGPRASLTTFRGEVLNGRVTHLAFTSPQEPMYMHSTVRQGHTHRGQALGSAAGYGGGASVLAVDRYDMHGRTTVAWERLQLGDASVGRGAAPNLFGGDVAHVWRVNRLRFGRRIDLELGAALVYEINRRPGEDAWSVQTTVGFLPMLRR